MGNEQSSSPGHKPGPNQHHHHHPNFVHPGAPENPEKKEESHPRIVKHRSLSPENPPKTARMNRYRASFRHGPNTLNTSNNSSGSSLTVSMNDGSRTPRRTKSFRPRSVFRDCLFLKSNAIFLASELIPLFVSLSVKSLGLLSLKNH